MSASTGDWAKNRRSRYQIIDFRTSSIADGSLHAPLHGQDQGPDWLGTGDVAESTDLIARARDLAGRWPKTEPSEKRSVLMTLIERVDLMRETLEIRSDPCRSAKEPVPSI